MEKHIKLIWDFRGPEAQKIAEHHVIHLKEYATAHDLDKNATGPVAAVFTRTIVAV